MSDDYISSWGIHADEVRAAMVDLQPQKAAYARIKIDAFQRLCDENGHVVKVELPGRICGHLRARPDCLYAEVIHTPNRADAVLFVAFPTGDTLDRALASLRTTVFRLEHLALPCPRLTVSRGPLDDLLP